MVVRQFNETLSMLAGVMYYHCVNYHFDQYVSAETTFTDIVILVSL